MSQNPGGGEKKVTFFCIRSFIIFVWFCTSKLGEDKEVAQRGDMTMRDQGWWVEWRGRTVGVPTNVFRHTRQTFHANESKERAKNPLKGNA